MIKGGDSQLTAKGIADDITAIAPGACTNLLEEIIQVIIEPNGENRLHVIQCHTVCHTGRALSSDVELYGPPETSSATVEGRRGSCASSRRDDPETFAAAFG